MALLNERHHIPSVCVKTLRGNEISRHQQENRRLRLHRVILKGSCVGAMKKVRSKKPKFSKVLKYKTH